MVVLDYKDRRPLYEQLGEKLRDLIYRGVLEPDAQLPSVRSLATELSINPNTIQRAYGELERQGFIYSIKGKGSFVSSGKEIQDKRKREIMEQLGILVTEARGMEIPREELTACVRRLYDEGGNEE